MLWKQKQKSRRIRSALSTSNECVSHDDSEQWQGFTFFPQAVHLVHLDLSESAFPQAQSPADEYMRVLGGILKP